MPTAARLTLLALLASAAPACKALDALALAIDGIAGPGWRAGPVTLRLAAAPEGGLALDAALAALELPAPLTGVRGLRVRCPRVEASAQQLACAQARVTLSIEGTPPLGLLGSVAFSALERRLRVAASPQPFAGGRLALDLDLAPGRLTLGLRLEAIAASALAELARGVGVTALGVAVSAGRLSGRVDFRAVGNGRRLAVRASGDGVAFSDDTGLHAAEELGFELAASAERGGERWRARAELGLERGTAYLEPILLEFADRPLRVVLDEITDLDGRVTIEGIRVSHGELSSLTGAIEMTRAPSPRLVAVRATLPPSNPQPLYRTFLKPLAGSGLAADLLVDGTLGARLDWRLDGPARLDLELRALDVGDARGRFGVLGLDGVVRWRSGTAGETSELDFDAAHLGRLELGGARVVVELLDDGARLLAPLVVPLLDGALRVTRLSARGIGSEGLRIELDSSLDPISMRTLSEHLAWLPLSGTLSGRVPALIYAGNTLEVAGDLTVELFDGTITIADLSVSHPFSPAPSLRADLTLDDLSLELLTRSMSFGRIEGRLDGTIGGLVMQGYRPVAFDAFLSTPPDDRSRHRISQRAVDNLVSLGGASAAISSTFLRLFETFSYDRLGLGCRLEAGVCEMRGVEPVDGGYYIVKGGGLPPRVDVIGFNRRVDWETLLGRLRAIGSAERPIIR